jgi:hypothetical protein
MLWHYDIAIAKRREMTKGAAWSKSTRASSIAVALPYARRSRTTELDFAIAAARMLAL